ncbi:methionine aminopeptidase 1 [Pestalotiopsis fici W106-1]|uniref:Methionine aminopeptidase n=1 Tax=Pestalotiopsis fici (strain W106-1 / CGMCC3.15140) TaxID=1229662 RepID=W3WQ58_PESFW|nr:methionine aminopeptidase 1 [Pestalotiopsis fici W106-1]ETS75262.1 methionine aminopeptidase 1 [Pestalotiopsis fici W106-1]
MTDTEPPAKKKCLGADCENDAGSLQCPTCLKLGIKDSFFCSQDCFKKNWGDHKSMHKTAQGKTQNGILHSIFPPKVVSKPDPATGFFNPFPSYPFTGSLRPVYPLSPKRTVPKSIPHPDYAETGIPKSARLINRNKFEILDAKSQEGMRKVCRLAREVLDIVAAELKPGITTDYLDEVCHKACIERNSYPSPLNYNHFPKSICTSPNEVICHGIPDQRILLDGDIINLDVTLYHEGFHGDLNETYYVGDRAKADPDAVRVVETARECLDKAIELVKPGALIRDFGNVIEKHAKERDCSVIRTYCGHGINSIFHCPPNVPHYAKNKAVGECKPGMTFTIEPMIALGKYRDVTWPDNWTSTTIDGKKTAQFEHTLLVTETGVEILTARQESSPGGPIPIPAPVENGTSG